MGTRMRRRFIALALLQAGLLAGAPLAAAAEPLPQVTQLATEAWRDAEPCGDRVYWAADHGWGSLDLGRQTADVIDPDAQVRDLACLDPLRGRVIVTQTIPGNDYLLHYDPLPGAWAGVALGSFYKVYVAPPRDGLFNLVLLSRDPLAHNDRPQLLLPDTSGALTDTAVLQADLGGHDEVDLFGGWIWRDQLLFALYDELFALDLRNPDAGFTAIAKPAALSHVDGMTAAGETALIVRGWAGPVLQFHRCAVLGDSLADCALLHRWPGERPSATARFVASADWVYRVAAGCGEAAGAVRQLVRLSVRDAGCEVVSAADRILALLPATGDGAERLIVSDGERPYLVVLPP